MGKKNKHPQHKKRQENNVCETTSELSDTRLATFMKRTELAAYICMVRKYGAAQNRVPVIFLNTGLLHFLAIFYLNTYIDKEDILNLSLRSFLLIFAICTNFMLVGTWLNHYFFNLLNDHYPAGFIESFDNSAISTVSEKLSIEECDRLINSMKQRLSVLKSWFQRNISIDNFLMSIPIFSIISYFVPVSYITYFATLPIIMAFNLSIINAVIASIDQSCINNFKQHLDSIICKFNLTWKEHLLDQLTVLTLSINSSHHEIINHKMFLSDLKIALNQQGIEILQCDDHEISVIYNADFSDDKALTVKELLDKRIRQHDANEERLKKQKPILNSLTENIYASYWQQFEKDEQLLPMIYLRLEKVLLKRELQEIFINGFQSVYGTTFKETDTYFEVPLIDKLCEEDVKTFKEQIDSFCEKEINNMRSLPRRDREIVIKTSAALSTSTFSFFATPSSQEGARDQYWKARNSGKEEKTELSESDTQNDEKNEISIFPIMTPGFKEKVFLQFSVTQKMFKNIREKPDVNAYTDYFNMLTNGVSFVPPQKKNGLVKLDPRSRHATDCQYKLKHINCNARVGVQDAGVITLPNGTTGRLLIADQVLEHRHKR